jgi:DNA-binding MarR family transcriptional regulator
MQIKLVIDAIVRQTTVLIAQLATSSGMRAPLAHIANQTFLSLTQELEQQGIGQKVIADMFGLALRSYQQKVQRLLESATDRGRSLWEAIYDYLQKKQIASRSEVLTRFARDDQASVRGILSDMVEAGIVYKTGHGDGTVYRVSSPEELAEVANRSALVSAEAIVWVTIYREGPLSELQLCDGLALEPSVVRAAIAALVTDGRVTVERTPASELYRSERCLIPLGQSAGWEAALLDHYQAMVRSICAKLNRGLTSARFDDRIGGSTYSFDVWVDHPFAERIYGLLAEHRRTLSDLWNEVSAYNAAEKQGQPVDRVTFYFGQMVTSEGQLNESDKGG